MTLTLTLAKESDENNQSILPKYLTHGFLHGEKNVVCDDINIFTPDGKKELIKNSTVKLLQGHRYGLIGRNGSGKSTLLNHISDYRIDSFPQYLRVVHIKQEADVMNDMKTLDYVVESDVLMKYLEDEKKRINDLIDEIQNNSNDENSLINQEMDTLVDQLDQIEQRLDILDPRTCISRAQNILRGLGFTDQMINGQTKELSGGWRVRAALACALFIKPDILLLDEPTNHLDFPAIDWLTGYMKAYDKCCVIVSHDRSFLNSVITDVIDLDSLSLTYYKGDYDAYVHVRDENQRSRENLYRKQMKKTEDLQEFIGKAKMSANQQTADSGANKKTMLGKMDLVPEPAKKHKWSFEFMDPGTLDHPVTTIDNVSFCWPESNNPLLNGVNGRIETNSRIGIMGANGVGKSTLLKLILGVDNIKVTSGKISLNPHARIYTFTQHHADQLDMELTPLEYFMKEFTLCGPGTEAKMRAFLGHYGFDGILISNKISTLSGGQKSRLAFATMCWYNPHCIIMDEPTNHLDLETVEALIQSLKTYKGGLITVSHDLYFLQNVTNEFWAINGKGNVEQFFDLYDAKNYSYQIIHDLKPFISQKKLNKITKNNEQEENLKVKKERKVKDKSKSLSKSLSKSKEKKDKKIKSVSLADEVLSSNKITSNSFDVLQRGKKKSKGEKKKDRYQYPDQDQDQD